MGEKELSTAEAELYDRQIRLWGIESQEKLRAANILLIGVRGLGSEIAKNILLSGINSLTILDHGTVTEEELLKNFLLSRDTIGKNIAESVILKAQALNPLVKIVADTDELQNKPEEFYNNFTMVIATRLKSSELIKIDGICRKSNVKFIGGDVFGMFGFSIADFQEHEYYEEKPQLVKSKKRVHDGTKRKEYERTTVKVQRKIQYPSLERVLPLSGKKLKQPLEKKKRCNELYYLVQILLKFREQNDRNPLYMKRDDDIKKLAELREEILNLYGVSEDKLKPEVLDVIFGEVPPICAIVGGVIAQEVIKAVSQKEVPINNVFLLDPFTYGGKEEVIGA